MNECIKRVCYLSKDSTHKSNLYMRWSIKKLKPRNSYSNPICHNLKILQIVGLRYGVKGLVYWRMIFLLEVGAKKNGLGLARIGFLI